MGVKAHQNVADSSKSEIGEIDTRAPFESVKAAVTLFGVAAFSSDKPTARKSKPLSTEVFPCRNELPKIYVHIYIYSS